MTTAKMTVESPHGQREFAEFYREGRDRLYRALALTLRDPARATEAVDEAMTRAYARWDEVSTFGNPQGWVYRVALNWAISAIRKSRREVVDPDPVDGLGADDDLPDPALVTAVAELPTDQRAVVVLRYYLDWSTDHVAEALDIPTGTVKSRLHRALTALQTRMELHDG